MKRKTKIKGILLSVLLVILMSVFSFAAEFNVPPENNWGEYGNQDAYWNAGYFRNLYSTSSKIVGTSPTLTIGDGGAEDIYLRFDGSTTEGNFKLCIDTTTGDFNIDSGTLTDVCGTNSAITITDSATPSVIIDVTATEALLIRQDADAADVFVVDTTNKRIGVNVTPTVGFHLTQSVNSNIGGLAIADTGGSNFRIWRSSGSDRTNFNSGTVIKHIMFDTGVTASTLLDVSDTPQAGLTGGLKYFSYAIALTDAAEDNTCTLGGTGVADCFVLPNPTSQGRLKLHTSSAEFGSYIVSTLGVTVEADGDADHANMEFNVANVAACANLKLCVFDYGRALTVDSISEDTCTGSGGSDCDGVYTGVTTTAAAAGTGVILTVTIASDLITVDAITSGGLSYVVNETLTLTGLVAAGCTECDDDATVDIATEGHVGIQNNLASGTTTVMVQFWYD
ncbi:hypothetical protein LCGC14_0359580 [marine sediment metagenome]|uniref:Uncharacterized protein n=1 Tax=marine sediment metagenome TaxID=412755 RepID=A0A0F9WGP4_9ZZZZ